MNGSRPPTKGKPKGGVTKKLKAKGNGEKEVAQVKCYNYRKKRHFAWDCLKPARPPFSTYSPKFYICSHELVANSFPKWTVDTGASKYIVQDCNG